MFIRKWRKKRREAQIGTRLPRDWVGVFLDFGIVVLGVGVALWAEQVISRAGEARETEFAIAALERDLSELFGVAGERVAVEPCRRQQIERLATSLSESGPRWDGHVWEPHDPTIEVTNIAAMQAVMRLPSRTWTSSTWSAVQASGVAGRLSQDQFAAFDQLFKHFERIELNEIETFALIGELSHLSVPGTISMAERRSALATLARLDQLSGLTGLMAAQSWEKIQAISPRLDPPTYWSTPAEFDAGLDYTVALYGPCVDRRTYNRLLDVYDYPETRTRQSASAE